MAGSLKINGCHTGRIHANLNIITYSKVNSGRLRACEQRTRRGGKPGGWRCYAEFGAFSRSSEHEMIFCKTIVVVHQSEAELEVVRLI